MKSTKKFNLKGFTLTEVIIVVSIIVFLALLVLLTLRTQIFKGRDARRKADLNRIRLAVEEYEKDHDCYPTSDIVICKPGIGLQPYLNKIPCDPGTNASYFVETSDSTCPSWYTIYTVLENIHDPDISKVGCSYGCGPSLAFNYYVSSSNSPDIFRGTFSDSTPSSTTGTTTPTIDPRIPVEDYYGCFNTICEKILWDTSRPGPECDPNYQNSTCYDQCSNPEKECKRWNE